MRVSEDKLIELALDAGAEDVKNEGEVFVVITGPTVIHKVKDAIAAAGIAIEASEVSFLPTTTIPLTPAAATKLLRLIDALEDNDDVQNVSHNAEIPESVAV